MPNPVLFVTGWFFSPQVTEEIPAGRVALRDIRKFAECDVFHWPCIRGGPTGPPTFAGAVDALREKITEDCHVVVSGGDVGVALAAMKDGPPVSSLVTTGFRPSPGTLRALGMGALADATSALYRVDRSQLFVRLLMLDAPDSVIQYWSERLDNDIDWPYAVQFRLDYEQVDLTRLGFKVNVPTLFLEPAIPVAGYADTKPIFERFVPNLSSAGVSWPSHLHEEACGREFAAAVVPFLQKHD
ncbi:MAG TPA: hypothetical protein VFO84_08925 [Dehalococcoidia bacterium]|nr:hypothetical protein [Dehalococcoidia bacterium]